MKRAAAAARATAVALTLIGLVTTSGCGVLIDFSSTPSRVGAGQTVTFDLKLSNPSQCPRGDIVAVVLPFLTPAQLGVEGPQGLQFLNALCTGTPIEAPGGITCRIEGNQLICEIGNGDTAPQTSNSLHVQAGLGTLDCHQEGGTLTCTLPDLSSLLPPNAVMPPPPALSCIPIGSPVNGFVCEVAILAPGASVSTTLMAAAPAIPGVLSNLVIAGASDRGVCKTGTNQGSPCSSDTDCSGVAGSCASGICVDSMTQATGAGCASNSDCPMTSTCVQCDPDGGPILIPLACSQTVVAELAPSMSTTGLIAAVLGLLGVGYLGLLRARRRAD